MRPRRALAAPTGRRLPFSSPHPCAALVRVPQTNTFGGDLETTRRLVSRTWCVFAGFGGRCRFRSWILLRLPNRGFLVEMFARLLLLFLVGCLL